MEITTAIATIIGVIMMVTVVMATVVIMGGLTQITVEECHPLEGYFASSSNSGPKCGTDTSGQRLYCSSITIGPITTSDTCMDESKNICCQTMLAGTGWKVAFKSGQCCNVTKMS